MRFRQLDGKAKGELRVTDIQRYADATHQKLNSSRTMDARYTHHARYAQLRDTCSQPALTHLVVLVVLWLSRLMRPVFEHMILPHAARRVAASSRRNQSELSETAVTQEDFVTGLVAFMGNRPSAEERIRGTWQGQAARCTMPTNDGHACCTRWAPQLCSGFCQKARVSFTLARSRRAGA